MKIARKLPAEGRGERASEVIKGTCVEPVVPLPLLFFPLVF